MKRLIGIFIIFITITGYAQNNKYHLKIELDGFNDSVYYLVSYYADKFQAVDTSFSHNNIIEFNGDSLLAGGIYILAGEKMNKYFEFLVDKDQEFKIQITKTQPIQSIRAIGSEDNEQFFEYLRFNKTEYDKIKALQNQLTKSEHITETEKIKKSIEDINAGLVRFKTNFIQDHPEALLSKIFMAMQEPEIDQSLSREQSYLRYKNQYWKQIDLTDLRMIRTPILHNKLTSFFDKIIVQHPDSLIKEIDLLLNQPIAEEIKNHFIWNLLLKYEYPDIMGLDKVFVHMVQNYLHTNIITGISQTVIETIEKRALKISRVLIGEKAPELTMMDTLNKPQSLYNLDADYTLVLFWDQECQTCQKEIKLLRDLLAENIFDLKVFAVGTDPKIDDWKKYIVENKLEMNHVNGTQSFTADYHELYDIYSTPTIYLLDRTKKIIAKRLSVEQLKDFIKNYQNTFGS